MKTHGGRSFLHGHHHGKTYFEPIGRAFQEAEIRRPIPLNPAHLWAIRGAALPYMKWMAGYNLRPVHRPTLPAMPENLRVHAEFACDRLWRSAWEISRTMQKHQLRLADRQCRMTEVSQRVQDLVTILCTSLYAARHDDEVIQTAADIL